MIYRTLQVCELLCLQDRSFLSSMSGIQGSGISHFTCPDKVKKRKLYP